MKIVFCLNAICYHGGIEKITLVKANALAEIPGIEVFIVVTDHDPRFQLLVPLSPKVHFIHLPVNYYDSNSTYSLKKKYLHCRKLRELLSQINPDIVIGVGQSEKYMLPRIKGPWKTIREFHFSRNYRKFYQPGLRNILLNAVSEIYDHYITLPKYDKVILLTHRDHKENWHSDPRFAVIPNMLTTPEVPMRDYDSFRSPKRIVAISRLEEVKNIDMSIKAFAIVAKSHPDWQFDIYGTGKEEKHLRRLIERLNLRDKVHLRGLTTDAGKVLDDADIFVQSSLHEGFGLSILEAMSRSLPVVSADTPCGPSDIITDGLDGLLVPVGDVKAMAEKINSLIENPQMRREIGERAWRRSRDFSISNIIPLHLALYHSLNP